MKTNLQKFIDVVADAIPYVIVAVTFAVSAAAIISLLLIDVITGQVTGKYISGDNWFGLLSSLAATGLLIATGALFASSMSKMGKGNWAYLATSGLVYVVLQVVDMYFDGLSVDIMRFGQLVNITTLPAQEAQAHQIYRIFIGGTSFAGELIGGAAIVAFPLLKKWIKKMLGVEEKPETPKPQYHAVKRPDDKPGKPNNPQMTATMQRIAEAQARSRASQAGQTGAQARPAYQPRPPFMGGDGE
jgi:hypothetical protein